MEHDSWCMSGAEHTPSFAKGKGATKGGQSTGAGGGPDGPTRRLAR